MWRQPVFQLWAIEYNFHPVANQENNMKRGLTFPDERYGTG